MVSRLIASSGTWEAHILRAMARFIKPGSRILNAGSHIGLEAITLGRIAGPTGQLYIFEPMPTTYSIVLKNVYLNNLSSMASVYNLGCSDKYATGVISTPLANTGNSIVYTNESMAKPPQNGEIRNQIETDRMDAVLPEGTELDFLLIDVQGLEVECLEGLKETMLRSPNLVLCVEWMGTSYTAGMSSRRREDLLDWFQNRKYKTYMLRAIRSGCQPDKFVIVDRPAIMATKA
jgi:FkbM family methyltransferase